MIDQSGERGPRQLPACRCYGNCFEYWFTFVVVRIRARRPIENSRSGRDARLWAGRVPFRSGDGGRASDKAAIVARDPAAPSTV